MLRVIGGIFKLPLILITGFIAFWVEFVSKIALFMASIINIGLFILMAYCGYHHDWLGVGISLGFSFILFVGCFIVYALDNFFKGLAGFEE